MGNILKISQLANISTQVVMPLLSVNLKFIELRAY